jgi:hypothetical protein
MAMLLLLLAVQCSRQQPQVALPAASSPAAQPALEPTGLLWLNCSTVISHQVESLLKVVLMTVTVLILPTLLILPRVTLGVARMGTRRAGDATRTHTALNDGCLCKKC